MQAFLSNFIYSRRTEAIFAQGRDDLLQLRMEKEKLAAKLQDACAQADLSIKMMELANESLKSSRDRRRAHAEEIAKLREELKKKRAAHAK